MKGMRKAPHLEGNRSSSSLKAIELNMLERLAIMHIAEKGFKNGVKKIRYLEKKGRDYISSLGEYGEKLFYENIATLEAIERHPSIYKKRRNL